MRSGKLDRQIQFQRAPLVDDGFTTQLGPFADHGELIWASKTDVSDGERWSAGQVDTSLSTRFVVGWSAFIASIRTTDKLVCDGVTYAIVGIKEGEGRRRWLEITAAAEEAA